ncbi:Ig-like domain-containing protein, partial [Flavobacterium helocola]
LTNDTLNGVVVTTSNTDVTATTEGPLSIDVNGVITVAANTPNGVYPITYTLCSTSLTPQICDTATAYVGVLVPGIHITKDGVYADANGDGFTSVGDVINYNFVVTNSGSTVLTNITVTDNNAVVTGGPLATLAIGASNSTMFTAVHTITAADIAAGYVYNLATATGTDTNGNPVTDTSSDPIPDPNPCVGCVVDPVCPDCTIVELTNNTFAINDINDTYINTPVSGNVLTNDFDLEGNTQVVTANTNPTNGTVVVNSNGTYTYTPNTNYVGTDSFTYTVCDNGTPQACDTATVTINVEQNPLPTDNSVVANNDAVITEVGTPVIVSVLSNDFDPNGNPFTITPGSVTTPVNGTVTVNPDGTITYTPNPLFVGEDTFTYQICDNQIPQACDTATVIVTVLPLSNLNTTYAIDDSYFINCSSNSTMNLLDNDYDLESNTQTINTIPVVQPLHGTVIINSDGTFIYTVSGCYTGPDSFIYQVCDNGTQQECDIATVYLLISANQSPVVTGTFPVANVQGCSATAAPAAVTTVTALETMGLTIADDCTPDATLVVTSADTSAGTCPIVVARTYTITDACGNFTTATQTINVQDTTAPVVTGTISVANVQGCSATAAPAAVTTVSALEGLGLTIADACTPDATLIVTSADTSAGTCPIVVTRTYTITDACGNFTTATQTINIQDTTAPVVTGTIPVATAQGCSASAAPSPVSTVVALEVLFGISVSD